MGDAPGYPDRFIARLATSGRAPSPYLLLADMLADIREQLPPGLMQSERQMADPLGVIETWSAGSTRPAALPPSPTASSLRHLNKMGS
jgi:hypothetical protein